MLIILASVKRKKMLGVMERIQDDNYILTKIYTVRFLLKHQSVMRMWLLQDNQLNEEIGIVSFHLVKVSNDIVSCI